MTPSPNSDAAFRGVCDALRHGDSFVITSHVRPDGDSMGSSLALALALDAAGKRTRVVMRDRLPVQFGEFPAVDRITYADDVPDDGTTVVVLECGDLERTGLRGIDRHRVINIDHHPGNTGFGDVEWFDGTAVACGEMVYAVIRDLGIPLTPEMATHIYVAIVTDTGSFRYPGVSPRTFEICARLLEAGADPVAIARLLFDGSTLGRLRLQGAVLSTLEIHDSGSIASLSVDHATIAASGATPEETDGLINIPLSVKQISAVAFFKEGEPGEFRVSLRSKGATDVGRIARDFGGGGHRNASGCTLAGSFADVRSRIIACLVDEVGGTAPRAGAPESRPRG